MQVEEMPEAAEGFRYMWRLIRTIWAANLLNWLSEATPPEDVSSHIAVANLLTAMDADAAIAKRKHDAFRKQARDAG